MKHRFDNQGVTILVQERRKERGSKESQSYDRKSPALPCSFDGTNRPSHNTAFRSVLGKAENQHESRCRLQLGCDR
jgi:hypothetical protein